MIKNLNQKLHNKNKFNLPLLLCWHGLLFLAYQCPVCHKVVLPFSRTFHCDHFGERWRVQYTAIGIGLVHLPILTYRYVSVLSMLDLVLCPRCRFEEYQELSRLLWVLMEMHFLKAAWSLLCSGSELKMICIWFSVTPTNDSLILYSIFRAPNPRYF